MSLPKLPTLKRKTVRVSWKPVVAVALIFAILFVAFYPSSENPLNIVILHERVEALEEKVSVLSELDASLTSLEQQLEAVDTLTENLLTQQTIINTQVSSINTWINGWENYWNSWLGAFGDWRAQVNNWINWWEATWNSWLAQFGDWQAQINTWINGWEATWNSWLAGFNDWQLQVNNWINWWENYWNSWLAQFGDWQAQVNIWINWWETTWNSWLAGFNDWQAQINAWISGWESYWNSWLGSFGDWQAQVNNWISEWENYWDSWLAQLGENLESIEAWINAVELYVYNVSETIKRIHGVIIPIHYPDVYSAYLGGERRVIVLGVSDDSLANKSVYGLTVTLCNATLYLGDCYVENFRVTGFHSVDSDVVYLKNVSSKNISFTNIFLRWNGAEMINVNTFFEIVNCKVRIDIGNVYNTIYINASTTPCTIKIQNTYFLGGSPFLFGEIFGEITNCIFNDSKLTLALPPYRGMSITGCSFYMYNSFNAFCLSLYNCWGGAVSAITISGCSFKPAAEYSMVHTGCIYGDHANFITISGCNFLVTPANARYGILMYQCNNWVIVGNVFDAAGKTAIDGTSCNVNIIVGNSLGGGSIDIDGYGNIIEHNY